MTGLEQAAQAQQARVLGIRVRRTFKQAAEKHRAEIKGKLKSADLDFWALNWAEPYIGELPIDQVHDGTLDRARLTPPMSPSAYRRPSERS